MSTEFGGEVLRQHGEFVRELARALTRDPGLAEDVAQDTWMRWLRRPPRAEVRSRGWLTLVARGILRNRSRGEQRRASLEARVAPGERFDATPLDACLQAEELERVIVAVRALEVPYRDVILARYFRGLAVRELALETGTSEETLRTRERRALEQLRGRLDREFGDRAAWAAMLGAFAPRATGALAWPWSAAAGAGLLALGGAALWWHASKPVTPAPAVVTLVEPAPAATSAAPAATATRQPATTAPRTRSAGSSSSASASLSGNGVELRGTFLLADGSPAANATWTLFGRSRGDGSGLHEAPPADWSDLSGTTDANGQLVLAFEPPRDFQFGLTVKAPAHAKAVWNRVALEPGKSVDLGTVTLGLGATITGRLVDGNGAPILGESWRVHADSRGLFSLAGRDECRVFCTLDPATGAFRLEDVQPGRTQLKAYSEMSGWLREDEVLAVGGQSLAVDIVYGGPRQAQRITLTTFCEPGYGDDVPRAEHIHLRADDGSERDAREIVGSSQSFAFDGLAPGLYLVEIADPRFKPWSQAGVAPGTVLRPHLEPCATLQLTVRDANGATLEPEEITVETVGSLYIPAQTIVHDGSVPFSGRIPLFPGDHLVRIRVGAQRELVIVEGIVADETRSLVHTFGGAAVLAGRLTRASGAGAADEEVLLLAPALVDDSSASPILAPGSVTTNPEAFRKQLGATRTGSDGAFRFVLPGPGAYVAAVRTAGGTVRSSEVHALALGQSATDLALVLPMGASVSGHLAVPAGSSAGLRLWIGPHSEGFEWFEACERAVPVASDGSFRLADLAAGSAKVRVLLPAEESFAGGGFVRSNAFSTWLELGSLELPDGASLVQDYTLAAAPGRLTVDVTLNGAPAIGLAFQALQHDAVERQDFELEGEAGPTGVCGPMLAFAGPWRLRFRGPDEEWLYLADVNPLVTSGGSTRVAVDITTAHGSVRFLATNGQPLAGREIHVRLDQPDHPWTFRRVRTDAEGRAELTLATGPYRFALALDQAGTAVEWSASGPSSADIVL